LVAIVFVPAGEVRIRQFGLPLFDKTLKEGVMKGVLFLVIWLSCAVVHTLYDLKVRPLLEGLGKEGEETFL
jgi:hypothetical protein